MSRLNIPCGNIFDKSNPLLYISCPMIKDSTQDITWVKSCHPYLTSDTYRLLGNQGDLRKHSYHFVGIGGIGMSAIAQILRGQGHTVSGSDRNHDRKITPEVFQKLQSQGISVLRI